MGFITISQGKREGMYDGPDGVLPVILTDISDPRTVTAQQGPRAGQDIDLVDWTFAVDGGEFDGQLLEASTTTASGPKSKMYAYITALCEGKAPPVGTEFEKRHLVGRTALATVRRTDDGWIRIENLGALPAHLRARPQAAPAPAPEPVAAAPASGPADLPF